MDRIGLDVIRDAETADPSTAATRNEWVAQAMGAEGIRVETPPELPGALDRAFSARKPCVVEVITEITAVAPLALVDQEE